MTDLNNRLLAALNELKDDSGVSLRQWAKSTGHTSQWLFRRISGEVPPDLDEYAEIAQGFGVHDGNDWVRAVVAKTSKR